jgi:hypothetical protein
MSASKTNELTVPAWLIAIRPSTVDAEPGRSLGDLPFFGLTCPRSLNERGFMR